MIDVAKIKIKAGSGGDGRVSFRREKFIPKGGPDGGDGGNGGNVFFVADSNLATLMDFHAKVIFEAVSGEGGGKKKMSGAGAEDLYIRVPVGTLIYEIKGETEILIADLSEEGIELLVARGGVGGKGNFRFRSSTNQTPTQYTAGTPGEEKEIRLEIKMVADVGLVGVPNAGKSTLLNRLTGANARIGDYPFTTLSPNLGVYKLKNGKDIVVADIPGLIEGASKGKGLGDEFLRHIERTRVLLHLVPGDSPEAMKTYEVIRKELSDYDENLAKKTEIIAVTKMDIPEIKENFTDLEKDFKKKDLEVFGISAATGEGIDQVMSRVMQILENTPKEPVSEVKIPTKLYTVENLPNRRMVFDKEVVLEKPKPISGPKHKRK
jgi:GTPase